jgi:hypothetical protein
MSRASEGGLAQCNRGRLIGLGLWQTIRVVFHHTVLSRVCPLAWPLFFRAPSDGLVEHRHAGGDVLVPARGACALRTLSGDTRPLRSQRPSGSASCSAVRRLAVRN